MYCAGGNGSDITCVTSVLFAIVYWVLYGPSSQIIILVELTWVALSYFDRFNWFSMQPNIPPIDYTREIVHVADFAFVLFNFCRNWLLASSVTCQTIFLFGERALTALCIPFNSCCHIRSVAVIKRCRPLTSICETLATPAFTSLKVETNTSKHSIRWYWLHTKSAFWYCDKLNSIFYQMPDCQFHQK